MLEEAPTVTGVAAVEALEGAGIVAFGGGVDKLGEVSAAVALIVEAPPPHCSTYYRYLGTCARRWMGWPMSLGWSIHQDPQKGLGQLGIGNWELGRTQLQNPKT